MVHFFTTLNIYLVNHFWKWGNYCGILKWKHIFSAVHHNVISVSVSNGNTPGAESLPKYNICFWDTGFWCISLCVLLFSQFVKSRLYSIKGIGKEPSKFNYYLTIEKTSTEAFKFGWSSKNSWLLNYTLWYIWLKLVFFFKLPLHAVLPGGIRFGHDGLCILELPGRWWACAGEMGRPAAQGGSFVSTVWSCYPICLFPEYKSLLTLQSVMFPDWSTATCLCQTGLLLFLWSVLLPFHCPSELYLGVPELSTFL